MPPANHVHRGNLCHRHILAVLAATKELQKMAVYFKAGLLGQPLLQFVKVTVGEVDNCAAIGANQVMVVLRWPPEQVASAVASSMYLADKPKLSEYIESAIDSHQADAGVLLMHPFKYLGRCKVVVAIGDHI